jgi:hypothetical protein
MARTARIAVGALLLAAVGVASFVFSPGARPIPAANARTLCGVERWTVKTLQDRPRLLPVRDTTIAYLVGRPPPSELAARLPFERRVFRITAAVTLVRPEDDGDFHLVLSDGQQTMIAETPSASCDLRATPGLQRQMAAARTQVRLCARARVTGVAFFDFDHGQTGVAPNAIELHPVLAFRCLSSASAAPATGGRGRVRLVSVTSPVSAGSDATLTVSVSRASTCSITVSYKSGPSSAQGLYPKRSSGGRVSWSWMVGTRTTAGRWPIVVSCGSIGTLRTSFVVT